MIVHGTDRPAAPKRVVVAGAHGFIGNAIASRLEAKGTPVLRVTRADADLLAEDGAARLAALLRPDDALVAAAAIAPVKSARMLRDNMTLVLALVEAASHVPLAHVVNIGSDAVYSDSASALTEDSITAPETLHGAMHLAREVVFRNEIKAPLAFLRPTLVYGARDPHNGYGPNRFRRLVALGEPIVLFGEGEERRDHVSVDDVAEIAVRVLERHSTGVLNVATGTVISFRELAELAVSLAAAPVPIKTSPRVGAMPHNGYRPFDPAATRAAFPNFTYERVSDGVARAHREEAVAHA